MRELVRQIAVLTAIAVCAALALAGVNMLTKDKIEEQKRLKLLKALEAVLPPHDNAPDRDYVDVEYGEIKLRFYIARKGGKSIACAVKTWSDAGYGGRIEVLTGILRNGDVYNIKVLYHRETPGLGSKVAAPEFLSRLVFKERGERRNLENTDWRVKKDGGDIDQITGATISPRAVVEAVRTALEVFSEVELFEDEALSASPEAAAPYGEQRAGDEPVE
ncbi:MAG TPA: RnfABCDGE type electron transport complex subunit G [Proteobacteria bacterium]|nr:RnfABCDGE type electron transport complex subunit G [Pseudomonadota bacterium]